MADEQIEEILRTMRTLTSMATIYERERPQSRRRLLQNEHSSTSSLTEDLESGDEDEEELQVNPYAINAEFTEAQLIAYTNTRAQSRFEELAAYYV